jgi:hypothetical protein
VGKWVSYRVEQAGIAEGSLPMKVFDHVSAALKAHLSQVRKEIPEPRALSWQEPQLQECGQKTVKIMSFAE